MKRMAARIWPRDDTGDRRRARKRALGSASEAERIIARALDAAATATGMQGEVSVLLCDDAAICVLNARWRGMDKATNVLSFPAAPMPGVHALLGDIALAFETVAREAESEGKTLADHTAHLAVHGFLHLVGHDHETDAQAQEMEAAERSILLGLGHADPYAALADAS